MYVQGYLYIHIYIDRSRYKCRSECVSIHYSTFQGENMRILGWRDIT
jgi:hypothetical protein